LSGHPGERFFGQHLALGRLNASKDLGAFKIPLFVGASVEVGNTWDEAFHEGPDTWLAAGSIYAGFSSPIGPVYLAAGFAEDGHNTIYLTLGNPFSARPYRPFD
jgi:NTE family protein